MARIRFRWNPDLKEMVEVGAYDDEPEGGVMVRGDVPDFVSPLDGSVVSGRKAYREHMKKHGVVPFEQGSEKSFTRKHADPTPRREQIWEAVDRAKNSRR